jgi:hypothetical protein
MTGVYHGIQEQGEKTVKAIDEERIRGNIFRNLHDIVATTGLLLKNYFDDMSLDWEDDRKASTEIWVVSIATFNQTTTENLGFIGPRKSTRDYWIKSFIEKVDRKISS